MKRLMLLASLCLFVGGCCWVDYAIEGNGKGTPAAEGATHAKGKVAAKVDVKKQATELSKIADTQQVGNETVVNLKGDLLFAKGSDQLTDAAKAQIDAIGQVVAKNPNQKVTVLGYTDNRGGEALNKSLSEKRAESVKAELAKGGVPAANIQAVGKGSADPIASNDQAAGRAQNRRAEIRLAQ